MTCGRVRLPEFYHHRRWSGSITQLNGYLCVVGFDGLMRVFSLFHPVFVLFVTVDGDYFTASVCDFDCCE